MPTLDWHLSSKGDPLVVANHQGTIFTIRKVRGGRAIPNEPFSGPLYEFTVNNNPDGAYAGYGTLSEAMRGAEKLAAELYTD